MNLYINIKHTGSRISKATNLKVENRHSLKVPLCYRKWTDSQNVTSSILLYIVQPHYAIT